MGHSDLFKYLFRCVRFQEPNSAHMKCSVQLWPLREWSLPGCCIPFWKWLSCGKGWINIFYVEDGDENALCKLLTTICRIKEFLDIG